MGLGGLFMAASALCLLYGAYTMIAYRDNLKLTEQELGELPQSVFGMVAAGVCCCAIGMYALAGELRPIAISRAKHSMDLHVLRPDFMSFNTRSKAIPVSLPQI